MDASFYNSLTEGDFGNGLKLGQSLLEGDFWPRCQGSYQVYRGQSYIDSIDYERVITSSTSKGTLVLPSHISHMADTDYFYAVRHASGSGKEEQGTMAVIKLSLDKDRKQQASRPNHVRNLRAEATTAGRIKLSWWYWPIGQQAIPARFAVFGDGATGTIDYEEPLGNVEWDGGFFYTFLSAPGSDGQTYRFGIRSVTTDGNDDGNMAFVEAIVDLTGPADIEGLNGDVGW